MNEKENMWLITHDVLMEAIRSKCGDLGPEEMSDAVVDTLNNMVRKYGAILWEDLNGEIHLIRPENVS